MLGENQEEKKQTPEEIQESIIEALANEDSQVSEDSQEEQDSQNQESESENQESESENPEKQDSEDSQEEQESEDQDSEVEEMKKEISNLKSEVISLKEALDMRLKEDLDQLSREDRALVEDLSEGDALERARVITKLLKAGKINKAYSPTQDAKAGQQNINPAPKTLEEAQQQVLKAIDARSL